MDQILAFLSNEAYVVVIATVVGMIYKFFPAFKRFSNEFIPALTTITAFLVHTLGPAPAEAGILGDIAKGSIGLFAPVVLSVIDSALAKFLHEHVLRGTAVALNVKKPE